MPVLPKEVGESEGKIMTRQQVVRALELLSVAGGSNRERDREAWVAVQKEFPRIFYALCRVQSIGPGLQHSAHTSGLRDEHKHLLKQRRRAHQDASPRIIPSLSVGGLPKPAAVEHCGELLPVEAAEVQVLVRKGREERVGLAV